MKKLLVILALLLATTAQAEERDIRQSLLDMFRAQVADLTDFDDELCGLIGTYYLLSTDGVWSCTTDVTVGTTGQIFIADGTLTDPAIAFISDPDTGLYSNAVGSMRFVSGGGAKLEVNASSVKLYDNLFLTDGTAAAPSVAFSTDTTTGLFLGSSVPAISVAGTARYYFTASYLQTEPLRPSNTAGVSEPQYAFLADPDTGFWLDYLAVGEIKAVIGGGTVGTFSSTGLSLTCATCEMTVGYDDDLTHSGDPQYNFADDGTGNPPQSGLGYNYAIGGNYVTMNVNGTMVQFWTSTYWAAYKPMRLYTSTAAAPIFTFQHDSNTGLYSTNAVTPSGQINFSSDGVDVLNFDSGGLNMATSKQIELWADVSNPGIYFAGDATTGFAGNGTGTILFRASSQNVMAVTSAQTTFYKRLAFDSSTGAALPVAVFTGDTTTGFYQVASGDGSVGISSAGTSVAVFDSGVLDMAANTVLTTDDLSIEGELDFGTACTFTAADTTPNPAGCSYWKTGGAVTITNFDGGTYRTGQTFIIEVAHNITISSCGTNFWCGDAAMTDDIFLRSGDYAQFTYRSDGFWAIQWDTSQTLNFDTQTLVFLGAEIAATNDVGMVWIPNDTYNSILTGFSCVASGGSTANLDVFIEDCNAPMTTCGATGATLSIVANDTSYTDFVIATDDINASGRWWTFNFGTVTTAPDKLTCAIEYITY